MRSLKAPFFPLLMKIPNPLRLAVFWKDTMCS